MLRIKKNLEQVQQQIQSAAQRAHRDQGDIFLVVVTKGRSIEEIHHLYRWGLRDFGENRVDEALIKMAALPSDIRWHFIGKLQKNKVNKIIGKFFLIHSVDTKELAEKIGRASAEKGIETAVLLEANTSGEKTKSGLSVQEWKNAYPELLQLKGIKILGFMTMAPFTEDVAIIRSCFSALKELQSECHKMGGCADHLSMGMSHDFPSAIQEGATLLRIGTAIFA